ncbi:MULTISPECIES: hypothetical protein [Amycolatopsis]|uniref:Uncharacterized protein n=2 Tax=Amycolatopsis TaxID=1813 RepID=A0A1I3ML17_9PSEU|nr:hypothetical protein [Amycolatopsis sacchari]SFI97480.1 hypothetical protein SAMN05421835_102375 [Amycolatopsis sacchari]
MAGGADLPEGFGFVVVACAGGEPKNLSSPSFDVLEGPYQEEQDGRYWDYLVQRHEGVSFDDPNQHIEASWECPAPQGGGASTGGDITPIPGTGDADAWQASNGGKPQVRYAPKTGVETGFGGTAQG